MLNTDYTMNFLTLNTNSVVQRHTRRMLATKKQVYIHEVKFLHTLLLQDN